ncbi:hypothetical protein GALMADRAFT_141630 [Galerina marginata CBS 339.88]|uniref:Uncharacterized protein n=1 Tax=Galerina marginata (strain CBS 339.88) TaxID=685588 RepID=A0A067SUW2_GALM3|nr:hypothetical protein GALMADRAFT_141630 [Galerina marginata CBS 339.88]
MTSSLAEARANLPAAAAAGGAGAQTRLPSDGTSTTLSPSALVKPAHPTPPQQSSAPEYTSLTPARKHAPPTASTSTGSSSNLSPNAVAGPCSIPSHPPRPIPLHLPPPTLQPTTSRTLPWPPSPHVSPSLRPSTQRKPILREQLHYQRRYCNTAARLDGQLEECDGRRAAQRTYDVTLRHGWKGSTRTRLRCREGGNEGGAAAVSPTPTDPALDLLPRYTPADGTRLKGEGGRITYRRRGVDICVDYSSKTTASFHFPSHFPSPSPPLPPPPPPPRLSRPPAYRQNQHQQQHRPRRLSGASVPHATPPCQMAHPFSPSTPSCTRTRQRDENFSYADEPSTSDGNDVLRCGWMGSTSSTTAQLRCREGRECRCRSGGSYADGHSTWIPAPAVDYSSKTTGLFPFPFPFPPPLPPPPPRPIAPPFCPSASLYTRTRQRDGNSS